MKPNIEFKMIAELDLEAIKVNLMHKESGEGWSLGQANAAEFEYRRFLCLTKLFPDERVAPLFDVDIFWHYHILDTMKYAVDCEHIFGYFLHHLPYSALGGQAGEADHHQNGARMLQLYEATFGEACIRQPSGTAPINTAWCAPEAVAGKVAWCAPGAATAKTAWCAPEAVAAKAAWCAPEAVAAKAAWCAPEAATAKTAWCAPEAATAKTAWCAPEAAAAKTAWCAPEAPTAKTAWCAPEAATARTAWCAPEAAPAKTAWCAPEAAPAKTAWCAPEAATAKVAWCAPEAATAKSAWCAPETATAKTAWCAPETATAKTAWCAPEAKKSAWVQEAAAIMGRAAALAPNDTRYARPMLASAA